MECKTLLVALALLPLAGCLGAERPACTTESAELAYRFLLPPDSAHGTPDLDRMNGTVRRDGDVAWQGTSRGACIPIEGAKPGRYELFAEGPWMNDCALQATDTFDYRGGAMSREVTVRTVCK